MTREEVKSERVLEPGSIIEHPENNKKIIDNLFKELTTARCAFQEATVMIKFKHEELMQGVVALYPELKNWDFIVDQSVVMIIKKKKEAQ